MLLAVVVLLLGACAGGGEGGSASSAEEANAHPANTQPANIQPLPDPGNPSTQIKLPSGRYATTEFEPSLSLSVGKGWAINNPEREDYFTIYNRDFAQSITEPGAVLSFVNVRSVFNPQKPTEGNAGPAPGDLVRWFEEHPGLDTSRAVRMTLGGMPAKRFDATVASLPQERPHECPDCLPVFSLGEFGEPVSIVEGFKQRITIVEDVDGQTVAIILYAPLDQFDRYLPEAQGVLDSIEWKGA